MKGSSHSSKGKGKGKKGKGDERDRNFGRDPRDVPPNLQNNPHLKARQDYRKKKLGIIGCRSDHCFLVGLLMDFQRGTLSREYCDEQLKVNYLALEEASKM